MFVDQVTFDLRKHSMDDSYRRDRIDMLQRLSANAASSYAVVYLSCNQAIVVMTKALHETVSPGFNVDDTVENHVSILSRHSVSLSCELRG
jgi:hypothetical protein